MDIQAVPANLEIARRNGYCGAPTRTPGAKKAEFVVIVSDRAAVQQSSSRSNMENYQYVIQPDFCAGPLPSGTSDQPMGCQAGSPALSLSDSRTQFLLTFVELQASKDEDKTIDHVLGSLNRLLKAGEIEQCDRILASSVSLIPSMPAGVIASFLGVTWKAREQLPSRSTFFEKAESFVTQTRGADESHRLLHWFK